MNDCRECSFYSPGHHACFHPKAWRPGYPFKEPGNPDLLNADLRCSWFDGTPPVEISPLKRLFRRLFR